MNEDQLNKKIANKIKKIKPDKGFTPYTMSLYKLCEQTGKPEYFNQIRNRIYRELEENESLSDYVRISTDHLENIFLCNDGVLIFSEILIDYFGEVEIKSIWMHMRELNKISKQEYDNEHMFDNFSISDLLYFIKVAKDPNLVNLKDEKEIAARKIMIEKAQAELKKRNVFKWGTEIAKILKIIK